MPHLVLARKYRPETFSSIHGQEHVTRVLTNAIKTDRIAHAHIFSGLRGVGKTTAARVFAKALNCAEGPTPTPCLKCQSCIDIARGNSLSVREIDGASHNSVDNIRELSQSFHHLPVPGTKYKVYIIDEAHMLSTAAFNALLKSLEEPPPNTVFILATTEREKILNTVISRCQCHDFRAIEQSTIVERLKMLCEQEDLKYEAQALRMVARLSEGSMRDAETMLDRIRTCLEGNITVSGTGESLGIVERPILFELSDHMLNRRPTEVLAILDDIFSKGNDPSIFLKELVSHFRELLIVKFNAKDGGKTFGISKEDEKELREQTENIAGADLQDIVHLVRTSADNAIRSGFPRYATEALLVRVATRIPVKDLAEIIAKIEELSPEQESKKKRVDEEIEEDILSHPLIQIILKTYPGSEITVLPERIEKVAITNGEEIYSLEEPYRHSDVLLKMQSEGVFSSDTQGFITSKGRFVDRIEAKKIAEKAKQLLYTTDDPRLFSEELWN